MVEKVSKAWVESRGWEATAPGVYRDARGRKWVARFCRPLAPGMEAVLVCRRSEAGLEYAMLYTERAAQN